MFSTSFEWFCPSILVPSRILRELSGEGDIGVSASPDLRRSSTIRDSLEEVKFKVHTVSFTDLGKLNFVSVRIS